MPARRKLKIFLGILGGLAAVLLLGAGALHVMFPSHHDTRIKEDSPLYIPAITLAPANNWEQRIRDAVLQQLPIGSTRQQIEGFLQHHFVRVQYRVARSDDERALARFSEPHIFIRAIDDWGFPGECRVEIYLLLTPEEHLRNVVVRSIEGYV
jgi:hypothetical protein